MKILLIIISLLGLSQKETNLDEVWNALIKVNQKNVPVYSSFKKDKIACYVKNDTIKEEYMELHLQQKYNGMFKVRFASAMKENYIREGWIEMKYVGVYLRPHGSSNVYPVYDKPMESAKHHNVINKNNTLIDVIDVSNDWLMVKMKLRGRWETGWMQKKYLCANPYSTCD